jgi:hypothetical protein
MDNQKIEVDGQEFDVQTVGEAMRDVIIGRAPVAVIAELDTSAGKKLPRQGVRSTIRRVDGAPRGRPRQRAIGCDHG